MAKESNTVKYSGFTLLEVVVAITIFGLCISLVYLLYNSVTSIAASVEQQAERDGAAKIILDRLAADLAAVYTGKQGYIVGVQPAGFSTEDPVLTITTTSHLQLDPKSPPVDIAMVRYYLREQPDTDIFSLFRSDTAMVAGMEIIGQSEEQKHLMSEEVVNLEIIFIGQDGEEYPEWNSAEDFDSDEEDALRFPQAFMVSLSLGIDGENESAATSYRLRIAQTKNRIEFEGEL